MPELLIAATGTVLATGLGAIPVILLGGRARRLQPALLGLAAGVMAVASIAGLLLPALDEGNLWQVVAGTAAGVGFLFGARVLIGSHGGGWAETPASRTSALVFLVLLVHSLPEGLAVGTAFASATEGLGLFVVVAITIQNIPEGTSIAIPMAAAGSRAGAQIWAGIASSLPQLPGAVVAYVLVEQVSALLPISFAFAAGAMLALVVVELAPSAWRGGRRQAAVGGLAGAVAMLAFSSVLGV